MNQETKEQSALLTQFYQAYAGWLDAGAPNEIGIPFYRTLGLCTNLEHWGWNYRLDRDTKNALFREMKAQFRTAGLGDQYPFNRNDGEMYTRECDFHITHENPERIKWVRDHAQ